MKNKIILGLMMLLVIVFTATAATYSKEDIMKALKNVYKRTNNKAKPYVTEDLFVQEEHKFPLEFLDVEWKKILSPKQYYILREQGTERAFSGKYDKFYEKGTYYSAATGEPLFSSDDKYDSKSGWPSFTKPIFKNAIRYRVDKSFFSTRIEIVDSMSGSHLGHVFEDGPNPTQLRYCVNSLSLIFVPEGGNPPKILGQ